MRIVNGCWLGNRQAHPRRVEGGTQTDPKTRATDPDIGCGRVYTNFTDKKANGSRRRTSGQVALRPLDPSTSSGRQALGRLRVKKVVRKAISSGTIVSFVRKLYRLLQDIPGSIRLFQLGGFVGEDKRVERRVVTRIKPLKAMQVVDFPDIMKEQRSKGATELIQMQRWTRGFGLMRSRTRKDGVTGSDNQTRRGCEQIHKPNGDFATGFYE